MSQSEKPDRSGEPKKAAGRSTLHARGGANRIADLQRDKPSASAKSIQPPRSNAPAGTPAGGGEAKGKAKGKAGGTRDYDIQGKPAARADDEPREPREPNKPASLSGDAVRRPGAQMPDPATAPSSKGQNTGLPEARSPDNTSVSDTSRAAHDTEKKRPSLSFAQGAAPLDSSPAQRPPSHDSTNHETTGDANLTSHLNDPAMRRAPPKGPAPESVGASHSDISPLARDGVTPADEMARLTQDAHDADQRGRLKGLAPREDVKEWRESEKEWQSDLPGQPRKL